MRRLILATLLTTLAIAAPRITSVTRVKVPVLAPADASITAPNIEATVGGAPSKVIAVATPSDDLILMLVLDLAVDLTLADRAKQAVLAELDQLPRRTHVALLRAQDGLRVLQDPGTEVSKIKAEVESLTVGGRSGLLDSIETAVAIGDSVLAKSTVRVAVLYITDSDVTNYREDFTNPVINSSDSGDLSRRFPEALIQEKISKLNANLARTQTPVFIVQISYRTDRRNEAYMNGLQQLATTTGGSATLCRSNAEITAAIGTALGAIRGHYSITLEVPKVRARSLDVKLAISDVNGEQQNIAYRSRFDLQKE